MKNHPYNKAENAKNRDQGEEFIKKKCPRTSILEHLKD